VVCLVLGLAAFRVWSPSVTLPRTFGTAAAGATPHVAATPIQHVVVIFQENHSFDNVLGGLCVRDHLQCDGATSGPLANGKTIPLAPMPDIVPQVDHRAIAQTTAIAHGRMNGFNHTAGCFGHKHVCYTQVTDAEIPTLRRLAERYVISDRTFSEDPVPSWGGHMDLLAGQLDGFRGANPFQDKKIAPNPGWGCDSRTDEPWRDPAKDSGPYIMVPACVPRPDGYGPYRRSPVEPVPTILDRLSSALVSWKLYTDVEKSQSGYLWSTCPIFADCLYDPNHHNAPSPNWVPRATFKTDAAAGRLPAYSVIIPNYNVSQHNYVSMLKGDNYIEGLVNAVMHGPRAAWDSTVIFITYDDCGCFYDHVTPPRGKRLGIRVPMVIVSPRAKASFVDHTQASFDSMLAFVEQNWKLAPLGARDAHAYDYCHSFVFTTLPCTGPAAGSHERAGRAAPGVVKLQPSVVPAASVRWMKTHRPDPNDPT
jgi:phospholipase C